jgi:hypothetical protein
LATDSLWVEKVKENGLLRLAGAVFGLGQIIQPADIQGHEDFLLLRKRVSYPAYSKNNHSWWKGKRGRHIWAGWDRRFRGNAAREGWVALPWFGHDYLAMKNGSPYLE